MTAPSVPCDTCGASIPDSDFETGSAIALLGKAYCPRCKGAAVKHISLEDLAPRGPARPAPKPPGKTDPPESKTPAPSRAPARTPAPSKPPDEKTPAPKSEERKRAASPEPAESSSAKAAEDKRSLGPRRKPSLAPSRSRLIVWSGAAIGVLIVILVGLLLLVNRKKEGVPADGPGPDRLPTAGLGPAATPAELQEKKARDAYAAVETLAARSDASPDAILAAVEQARAACRGTRFEARLEDHRLKAARDRETGEALRELNPLIEELKAAVASDPEFKRYAELQPKFQRARDLSVRAGQNRGDIQALQSDYGARYEKAAEPFYEPIHTAASVLADERRYDDALKQIETFPAHLRHSGAWKSLDRLKQDIDRRKKALPKK